MKCGFGEDYWESFGLQGDPTSPDTTDLIWCDHVFRWHRPNTKMWRRAEEPLDQHKRGEW